MRRCLLLFEPPDGGVPEHVLLLAASLPGRGWEVDVAGPPEAGVYERMEQAGVRIIRLPFDRALRPRPYIRVFRELLGLARSGRYDVMHVHSSKAGVIGRLAAWMGRLPVVYTPHCFAFIGPHPIWRKLPVTLVERSLAHLTDAIICVCENERQEALQLGVSRPDRFRVVHNGCADCPAGLDTDPELAAHAEGGPLAASLAALRPQKAVDVFVRAAPQILRDVPDARLAVIGQGDERSRLEELARRLRIDERLRFFDFRPPAARQLSSIDVFVLSSAWEAFPIAVLEALACGVPQVATDVGGTSEAVIDGETGLLCPPGRPEALASRVSELLVDSDRRASMAQQSLNRYRANFSWDRMASETAVVLAEVIDAGARVNA